MGTQNGLYCNNDGKPLTGLQRRWCSERCMDTGWAKEHREDRNRTSRESKARRRGRLPLKPRDQRLVDLEVENARLRASLRRGDQR